MPLSLAEGIRTWTDLQNRKIEASLVKVTGESVVFQLADGSQVTYPLARLSSADRKVAAQLDLTAAAAELARPGVPVVGDRFNFDAPWPDRIKFDGDPEIFVVKEDAAEKRFIYESANYRYVCDVRLAKSVVKGFAVLFEATHLYCRSLPLAINGGVKITGKHEIELFEKYDDYEKAGGPPDTAGVFDGRRGIVMVPLTSLGVRPVGSGYMLDREKSSSTLPHELTHQLTPPCYFQKGALGWFSEGLAEYVAVTPYRAGGFGVRGNRNDIVLHVTGYGNRDQGGRALGRKIELPALKTFMLQSYGSFSENSQLSYGGALLITDYFMHLDGAGDSRRLKDFLRALHQGKDGVQSIDLLLDGRTFPQLEEQMAKAWSSRGVDLAFAKE